LTFFAVVVMLVTAKPTEHSPGFAAQLGRGARYNKTVVADSGIRLALIQAAKCLEQLLTVVACSCRKATQICRSYLVRLV
jgi:hypothetical protein